MKITRNTSDQLILSHTPWLTGLFLVGVFLLGLASLVGHQNNGSIGRFEYVFSLLLMSFVCGLMAIRLVQRIQIIFDKPSDTVTIRRRSILKTYKSETHRLSDFRCSEMQTANNDKREPSFRPVLHFVRTDGVSSIPLIEGYTQWSDQTHRSMAYLNDWVKVNVVDSGGRSA